MATHEYVWVRGGGQLFLATMRNNIKNISYSRLSKKGHDRVKTNNTQFDVRIRLVKSRTIMEHIARSCLPRLLMIFLEEAFLKDARCR